MSKIITVSDINNTKFYQLPKAFFHNPLYINMKNESKLAYSILRDLLELSIKNNWVNEQNQVYVKLSREKLMRHLNIKGTQKMTQIMNELKEKDLIVEHQLGLNKCNEIYICIPEELNIIYTDEELLKYDKEENVLQNIDKSRTFENQKSGVLKNKGPEIRKSKVQTFENQRHTNTNITNTNLTNTNTTTNKASSSISLLTEFEENICTLRKTTLSKFKEYLNNYDDEFIRTVIEYCAEISINSFAGFKKIIDSYISKNIITKEEFTLSIETYRSSKNTNSNTYLKQPDAFINYQQRNYTKEQFDTIEQAIMPMVEEVDGEALLKKIRESRNN